MPPIDKHFPTLFLTLILIIVFSCQTQKADLKTPCIENLDFREYFFKCLNNVFSFTYGIRNQDGGSVTFDEFQSSLHKISIYTHSVNWDILYGCWGGNGRYTGLNAYESDERKWLKWYEENKCKNLQWK